MKRKIIGIVSFICLLVLGIYFWNTRVDENQVRISNVYNLVDYVRAADVPANPNRLGVMQDRLDEIVDIALPDYTIDNNVKKSIQNFLQRTTGKTVDISGIESAVAVEEGQSGDLLFFIRDNHNNLMYVVKLFSDPTHPEGSFLKELTGFALTSKIHGKNFHVVTAEALGKCMIDGDVYGMIAMSPAKGINMQTLVVNVFRLPKGSPEREDTLHIAQVAVEKLGAALTELHQARTQKDMPLDPEIIQRAQGYLNEMVEHLEDENSRVDIDVRASQEYFAHLVREIKNIKTTRSIVHGDAHLGNFLYDESTDSITMVDYNEFYRSVDAEGNPLGNAAFDVMSMLDIIAANKVFGLTDEEVRILSDAFVRGYGSMPTDVEQAFFVLLGRLNFVAWFWMMEKTHPEAFADHKLKKVTMYMLDELQKSLVACLSS